MTADDELDMEPEGGDFAATRVDLVLPLLVLENKIYLVPKEGEPMFLCNMNELSENEQARLASIMGW